MSCRYLLLSGAALALGHWAVPACAAATAGHTAPGIEPLDDAQLADMRGRYTIGNNAVAWFGVQMISTWRDANGRVLQGTLSLAMDFTHDPNLPKVSFVPTVTITPAQVAVAMPAVAPVARHLDSRGLANVAGMQQSVQIAGDGNQADNVTRLAVLDGDTAPVSAASGGTQGIGVDATVHEGDASVTASYTGNAAKVVLSIAGQGAVQQWIRNGSLGQSVALAADNQYASNQLEITLIRQSLSTNMLLAQNVAQSIHSIRGIAR
jgi:hypothetical protein